MLGSVLPCSRWGTLPRLNEAEACGQCGRGCGSTRTLSLSLSLLLKPRGVPVDEGDDPPLGPLRPATAVLFIARPCLPSVHVVESLQDVGEGRSEFGGVVPTLLHQIRQFRGPLAADNGPLPTVDHSGVKLIAAHPVEGLLKGHNLPQDDSERVHVGLVIVRPAVSHLGSHVPEAPRLPAHLVHLIGLGVGRLHDPRQSEVDQLHLPVQRESDVARLEIAVEDHAPRIGLTVAVVHGRGDGTGALEDGHVRQRLLLPEPTASVAYAGVVAEHLGEGAAVEALKDDEARTLGGRTSPDEGDNVGMIEFGVNLQFPLDLVDGQR
mmetsp:Transcript_14524/g.42541  ORF Transcript_14524/g.42541 Transcript_14524/m.42541 type:complete len:322 (+) Transcript_14524:162-1127(+)